MTLEGRTYPSSSDITTRRNQFMARLQLRNFSPTVGPHMSLRQFPRNKRKLPRARKNRPASTSTNGSSPYLTQPVANFATKTTRFPRESWAKTYLSIGLTFPSVNWTARFNTYSWAAKTPFQNCTGIRVVWKYLLLLLLARRNASWSTVMMRRIVCIILQHHWRILTCTGTRFCSRHEFGKLSSNQERSSSCLMAPITR